MVGPAVSIVGYPSYREQFRLQWMHPIEESAVMRTDVAHEVQAAHSLFELRSGQVERTRNRILRFPRRITVQMRQTSLVEDLDCHPGWKSANVLAQMMHDGIFLRP